MGRRGLITPMVHPWPSEGRPVSEPADRSLDLSPPERGGLTLELLSRIRAGDQQAWEALYRRYHDELLFAVRTHLGPRLRSALESEDVLQSVAIEALRSLPQLELREPGGLRHYLHKMIVNKIRDRADYFAAQKRDGGVSLSTTEMHAIPDGGGEPRYNDSERYERLESALRLLPPDMERVIVLRKIDGLSSVQAAQMMGKSDVAVRKLYSRALARLSSLVLGVGS